MTSPFFIQPLGFKDILSVGEFDAVTALALYDTAARVKADPRAFHGALSGRVVAMLFEKPSLRTRVSFEAGVARLGGHAIYFDNHASPLGQRESVRDAAGTLERMVDLIVCRTHAHAPLAELARLARVPVVNALCERFHPCQALADVMTIREHLGAIERVNITYLGDGNNVCHSLMLLCATLGARFTAACPAGYAPEPAVVAEASARADASAGSVRVTDTPDAVAGADVVYTDTWVSMGDEQEKAKRMSAFAPFRVDAPSMSRAAKGALFMHCLPAKRGLEVTDEVMDSPASVVFDQAENRMHAQNALLLHMLCPGRELGSRSTAGPTVHTKPKPVLRTTAARSSSTAN